MTLPNNNSDNQNTVEVIEVDLDPKLAREEFEKYKDNDFQPKGYNILIHQPPKNPDNRCILGEDGILCKVIVGLEDDPLQWDISQLGIAWDWAVTDVWAWMLHENDQMYHVSFTTTKAETDKLRNIGKYFDNLLVNDYNIYENDKFAKFLPSGMNYRDMYIREISNTKRKIKEIGVGYLEREGDFTVNACIPEDNLSNEVLEKWHGPLVEFINLNLSRLNFSQGEIS